MTMSFIVAMMIMRIVSRHTPQRPTPSACRLTEPPPLLQIPKTSRKNLETQALVPWHSPHGVDLGGLQQAAEIRAGSKQEHRLLLLVVFLSCPITTLTILTTRRRHLLTLDGTDDAPYVGFLRTSNLMISGKACPRLRLRVRPFVHLLALGFGVVSVPGVL